METTGKFSILSGIYRSSDCGYEIAVSEGEKFAPCPIHGHEVTWFLVRSVLGSGLLLNSVCEKAKVNPVTIYDLFREIGNSKYLSQPKTISDLMFAHPSTTSTY